MDPLWFASLCWWPLFSLFSGASLFFPLALFSARYSTFYLYLFLFSFAFLSLYSSYFGVLSDLLVRGGYQLIYNRTIMVIILIDFHSSVDNTPLKIFCLRESHREDLQRRSLFLFSQEILLFYFFFLLEKLIEHARQVSLEHYRETSSACALFVCNKWDQVPSEETDEVKDHIVRKLKRCWPNVDPESQIIYMSSTTAREAQTLGIISEEFAALMNGIKSMVLKSVKERLFVQWR